MIHYHTTNTILIISYTYAGKPRLLELLDWLQANRKTEATFRLANPTHTEMGMHYIY